MLRTDIHEQETCYSEPGAAFPETVVGDDFPGRAVRLCCKQQLPGHVHLLPQMCEQSQSMPGQNVGPVEKPWRRSVGLLQFWKRISNIRQLQDKYKISQ